MATATQQTQAQSAHTPSASASSDPSSSDQDLLWEGDKMFNIYIWDYCTKRGYSNTARELAEEAKLAPNPRPPIDAKQGLLYEWWSVFWVLFSAKSNNAGSEDAMVYIQNHMAQARMHQVPGAISRFPNGLRGLPGGPGSMPTGPNSLGAGAPPHPNQPPNTHPMPNGIGPTPPAQQQHGQPQGQGPHPQQTPAQQQQPPQAPPPLGFPAHVQQQQPQPNGVPAHGRPPMAGQGQHGPGAGPGTGQPARSQMPFYQSPTMAHPQASGTAGPPPPYPGPGPLAAPNMYPQPHMRGMLPPGAPNGVGGVAGSPGFPQGAAGAGSRAATPAQPAGAGITQPSPSMAHRSVPVTPPNFGGPSGMPVPGGRGPPFDQANAEIQKIDVATMNELRQELGLPNKDPLTMSLEEKNRLLNTFKQRNAPGPSNPARPQQGRGSKRNSVSPGDEHAEVPVKGEASPPAQKRARRSPEQPAQPAPGPAGTAQQGGPSNANPNPMGGMYPPNMVPNGMRAGGPPFTPQMAAMGMGQAPPGMMMHPGAHPGMGNPQMQQLTHMQFQKNSNQAYHANLQAQAMHKMNAAGISMPPSMFVPSTGDNLSNLSSDPQQLQQPPFGPDPNQQRSAPPSFATAANQRQGVGQGKMLPPSSPATSTNANGQGKPPQGAQGKVEGGGKVESSPRSGPPPPPSGSTGPSPPTPVPGPGQVGTSAPSPSITNQSRPTTSTSNPPGGASGPAPPAPAPPASAPPGPAEQLSAGFDFMSTGFDDFTSMFGRDENLDFDRDFGSWFSGDMSISDLSK